MNPKRARLLAEWAHRAQPQLPGEPLIAHVRRVAAAAPQFARAHGQAGDLARAVKVADLRDRLQHPGPRTNGSRPPYGEALQMLLDRPAAGGLAGT